MKLPQEPKSALHKKQNNNNTKHGREKKNKKSQHPYDKLDKMRQKCEKPISAERR